MRFAILLSTFLVCSLNLSAQKKGVMANDATKYMNTITADELKTHLFIVASNKMEGRETGSKGQKEAGKYLIEQYKKIEVGI